MSLDERLRHSDDRFSLVPKEASGLNLSFQHSGVGRRVVGGRAVLREQMRRNDVHARVGALRGKNRRDHQLHGIAMLQRARRVRILALQARYDLPHPRFPFSRRDFRLHGQPESSSVRSRQVSRSSSPALATEYSPAAVPPASFGANDALPSSRAAAISISPAAGSSGSARPSNPTALNPGRSGRIPKIARTSIAPPPTEAASVTNIPSSGSGGLASFGAPQTRSSGSCRYCAG